MKFSDIPWPDLRRRRAEGLTHAAMGVLNQYLPSILQQSAYTRLVEAFSDLGVEFVTDEDRQRAGLAERGPLGYTAEELYIMETQRKMAMLTPLPTFIIPKEEIAEACAATLRLKSSSPSEAVVQNYLSSRTSK